MSAPSTDSRGKRVRLAFDQAKAPRAHKDRYRRTLDYALLKDGKPLNAEIIKEGYGFAFTRYPSRGGGVSPLEKEAREPLREHCQACCAA